ncbi:MAG: T9SS type A sorting domain-containing protein [Bacteroidales bacterium]
MTEKQTDNTLPVLHNRLTFCKISVLTALLLLFATPFTLAQTWSEPSVIWAKPLLAQRTDFIFDLDGNIHCVWSTKHGTNYYLIYHSRSTDDGETWSNPISPSQNSSMWMTQPHIVCDSDNQLHLTYDHNVGSIINLQIIHKVYNGIHWGAADTVTIGEAGFEHNRLAIDKDDRLYCFWFTGGTSNGRARYRYKDKGSGTWSETIQPYSDSLKVFIQKVIIDDNNTIHCVGSTNVLGNSWYHISYFNTSGGIWNPIENVGPLTTGNKSDMALDNQNHPHVVWQHKGLQSPPGTDSTMYRYFDGTTWPESEFIVQQGAQMAVCVDHYNNKHIVVSQKSEAGYQLVHYRYLAGSWVGQVIDEHEYSHYDPKLIHRGSKLYLVHCMTDTIVGNTGHTRIVMRQYDIVTAQKEIENQTVDRLNVFPNPFGYQTNIHFEILNKARVNVQVYNIKGELQTTLFSSEREPGKIELTWDGTDSYGMRVPSGIYMVKIVAADKTFLNKVELIK